MKDSVKRIISWLFILGIIAISFLIFLNREQIQHVPIVSYPGIIAICCLANATVFLPSPSLMVVSSCSLIMNPLLVAFCGALGSSLGEIVGYGAGNVGREISTKFQNLADWLTSRIHSDSLFVFLLALLPLPIFDVAGVYAGGKKMSMLKFFSSCFLGKFLKTLAYSQYFKIIQWLYQFVVI